MNTENPRSSTRIDETERPTPPYRAIAMVLFTAVVLAAGIGIAQLLGSDDDDSAEPAAATTSAQVTSSASAPTGQSGGQAGVQEAQASPAPGAPMAPASGENGQPQAAPASGQAAPVSGQAGQAGPSGEGAVPVRVYNNSTVTGLAGRTRDQLQQAGFQVGQVANLPSNQGVVSRTEVFFGAGPGEQATAEAVAGRLGVQAAPRPAEFPDSAPGVVVVVAQDQQR